MTEYEISFVMNSTLEFEDNGKLVEYSSFSRGSPLLEGRKDILVFYAVKR